MSDENLRITQTVFASHSKALYARLHVAKHATSQRKFFEFCLQLGQLHPSGSPCPTDEYTLCLFATFLATFVHHSTMKVSLSGVRASSRGYQIHYRTVFVCNVLFVGLSDLRVLCRLIVCPSRIATIWKSLNVHLPDHCMVLAACTLGYFGFLRAGEFTLPNLASFSSLTHLTVQDITVDGASSPSCMRVTIKASKTNPFRKGLTCILVWEAIRSVRCKP